MTDQRGAGNIKLGSTPPPLATAKTKGTVGSKPSSSYDALCPTYTSYKDKLTDSFKSQISSVLKVWAKSKKRYGAVALETNIPACLIAALHHRESACDFSTYLHQGDPLGKPAVNEPNDIPVFYDWEPAAIHALLMKASVRDFHQITFRTSDLNALCAFAERYNGHGYKNRSLPSPYVLSGTEGYSKGKFVSDGKFDANVVDKQIGVLPLMRTVLDFEASIV